MSGSVSNYRDFLSSAAFFIRAFEAFINAKEKAFRLAVLVSSFSSCVEGFCNIAFAVHRMSREMWQILGFADWVEVIAPPELRRKVASAASNMNKMYQDKSRKIPIALEETK